MRHVEGAATAAPAAATLARVVEALAREGRDDAPNERRASRGEAAIVIGDPDFGENELFSSATDTIVNVCHALDRMGLSVDEVLAAARRFYERDRGGQEGPQAEHDAERYPDPDEPPADARDVGAADDPNGCP